MEKNDKKLNLEVRAPIVVVMGHIDHGKSTLLDYIRKTNITENEAGGITQKISAYEVVHKDLPAQAGENGKDRKITFLDTPGHEAFSKMRERGAQIADIAILVVSAEDGVKPQTIEAWKTIVESKTPCIVAINKIDKPGANVEKTKKELAENEIYLENYGGKVPYAEISAKIGTGIDNLLSLILILAEMENLTGSIEEDASGFVIEVNLDSRRGILATLIIKNGSIKKGMTVVVEDSLCSTRIIENFSGKMIDEASFSSPIRIVGFDKMPRVGAQFKSFQKKSDAEKYAKNLPPHPSDTPPQRGGEIPRLDKEGVGSGKKVIPIILKADVSGSIEAIEKEIAKINSELNATVSKNAEFRIVGKGIGPISESDIKGVASGINALVIGFNVKTDKSAIEIAQKRGVIISFFNIIYKLTEWLEEQMEEKRPRIETIETTGRAKIIRAFSRTKERQIVGGKVIEGQINLNSTVKIMRREFEIGRGKIVNLEKNKVKTSIVEEGAEFGMMIESKIEVVAGDMIEAFNVVQK
ncbi:MAG: Translation initiation factor IF-2 protein [Candidatus Nomurabacteria bacterium GW2011_GWA2_41_25]|uniref:Translation initiation factor IF-2 n=2 Tax=Candidatus Nomuraibacteriota TaxID=1752729 RepID=A0A1F6YCX7_9BACT|nr:MAG: Translation initiation factor IF-2 protein [Candidatus Nomurabacteria bacterium GW2011_GWA2_41_25]OGI67457.1 MAG: translation initiation factor IF-2 [Candidatus Nomurabacteria bacterium RIFCSPHIGHO2_01_FULL_41_91]OGI80532.1 MAG: translation initiation factor IF-2 [Candidatus Nomurabacteria bacterium RIFCSPHIGHO2_02_FULL_41_52]OGI84688.1 MAG: translation initiation factor IF-2 [Candidatus Nomurabacteria bacterium RIFCSPHIGHO2_12_FULL_42_19]OGI93817.1 MAG: translation initiation factor IF